MNTTIYLLLFIFLFIIITLEKNKKSDWITTHLKSKKRKENHIMNEAAKIFINKRCIIHLLSGEVDGIIREVTDNSLLVETKTENQIINLEFVMRIREYPESKRRKKSMSID